MFFITGDTHRDFARIARFCEGYDTSLDDVLIILGDVGINYCLDYRDEKLKQQVDKLPITIFAIHGNHEERPVNIPTYKEKKWNDGIVYYEEEHPNLVFARDGEVYLIGSKKA